MVFLRPFLILLSILTLGFRRSEGMVFPSDFRQIFIGRCAYFQEVLRPELFGNGQRKNCSFLWDTFQKAWMGKDPCDVTKESYSDFIDAAQHQFNTSNALLWAGTFLFVKGYTDNGRRINRLGDTLVGHVLDGISWCDTNESACPRDSPCYSNVILSFWHPASKKYASRLTGTVNIMANGGFPHVFPNTSILVKFEIPALIPENVSLVQVNIINPIEESRYSMSCRRNDSSLDRVLKMIKDRGMKVSCYENPPPIRHYLCIDQSDNKYCHLKTDVSLGLQVRPTLPFFLTNVVFIAAMLR